MIFQEKYFLCYILLTEQISLSDFEISDIMSFVIVCYQFVTSQIQKNNWNTSTKRALEVRQKTFFIIFKGLPVPRNCLKPVNAPLARNEEKGASSLWKVTSDCEKQLETTKAAATQKMNFSIKDFFSKCEPIHRFLWVCLHFNKRNP